MIDSVGGGRPARLWGPGKCLRRRPPVPWPAGLDTIDKGVIKVAIEPYMPYTDVKTAS